ncbi:MAG TPA: ATP-binding protein [Candidatus Binataceae bacterium]|nr:ATP-binding protein [Candidatus Binataceae bacterium]
MSGGFALVAAISTLIGASGVTELARLVPDGDQVSIAVGAAIVGALLFALVVGYRFSASITQSIEQMVCAMQAVAEGDLLRRIKIRSHDERQLGYTLDTTIAAFRESSAALTAAREDALAASTAKSAFLSSMSREIRTPMNAILGMSELLEETPLSDEQRRFLGIMRSNGAALLDLINDILDLSKVESGRLTLERAEFDIEVLVETAVETFSLRAYERGIELATHIREGVPSNLIGDSPRLRQILINLVGNAMKFTERGEIIVGISPEHIAEDFVHLHFTVLDTGIGIREDKCEAIFANFTQVDSSISRKYGGTGLGLAIVRRLVELMNGRIRVESEEGRGSIFHFTAQFGVGSASASDQIASTRARLRGLRALVADDNETNRLILREMLGRAGAVVDEASDGMTALALNAHATASGQPFQLILLDCRMPGMDGFEVARQLPCRTGRTILMLSS